MFRGWDKSKLMHRPQRIPQEVLRPANILLRDTVHPVKVRGRPFGKYLSQTSVQIQGVVGCHAVYRLLQTVSFCTLHFTD